MAQSQIINIDITHQELTAFLSKAKGYCHTALDKRPYARYMVAELLGKTFSHDTILCIKECLMLSQYGAICLHLPEESNLDDGSYLQLLTGFAFLLGQTFDDEMTGKYYALVELQKNYTGDSYLHEPFHDLRLHTDGSFYEHETDFVFLAKPKQFGVTGGELSLLAINDIPELSDILNKPQSFQPYSFRASKSKKIDNTVHKPIFTQEQNQVAIRFSDQFCYPDTISSAKFINDLSDTFENNSQKKILEFSEKQLLLLNNRYWLHGRQKFLSLEKDFVRKLLRIRGRFS